MGGKILKQEEGIGLSFGRLLVLGWSGRTTRNHQLWLCVCRCGTFTRAEMYDLTTGKVQSCGCLKREILQFGSTTHGATLDRQSDLGRTFGIWVDMRGRCRNEQDPTFKHYGGRGIQVAPEWEEFSRFLSDMGTCPKGYSIERHNVNEGYSLANCYWWPRSKQNMNKTNTIRVRYLGQDWCFKRLCEHLQRPYLKTYKRYVMRGWDLARALDLTKEETHDLARLE